SVQETVVATITMLWTT
nr:immunoglobulin heavy chain junction region [Mus musculus]